jgi:triacylglycerol lipase
VKNFDPQATAYAPHNALWLGQMANLAYADLTQAGQSLDQAGLYRFAPISDAASDTQGFVAGNGEVTLIAYRGTEAAKLRDWLTDLDALQMAGPVGQVHKGFYERGVLRVWEQLVAGLTLVRDAGQPLWLTGHSLGAALACLTAAKLLKDGLVSEVAGLYTFGQPRSGDQDFATWFDSLMKPRTFRFVNNNDIVPHVPPPLMHYKHAGTFVYFDAHGDVKADEGFWAGAKDALEGRVDDLWQHGIVPPVIEDHFMDNYLERLQGNVGVNPFGG